MNKLVILETLDNLQSNDGTDGLTFNKPCYEAIVEHWVEARIDGPVQAIARYDDAAKQLITIGGFLQAGLIAVYSVLAKQQNPLSISGVQKFELILFGISLLGFLSVAAWVCSIQPEMQVRPISYLLTLALKGPLSEGDLTKEVEDWCRNFEESVKGKRNGMLIAKCLFILCSLTMYLLLLSLLGLGRGL